MIANLSALESLQSAHGHSVATSSMAVFNALPASTPPKVNKWLAEAEHALTNILVELKEYVKANDKNAIAYYDKIQKIRRHLNDFWNDFAQKEVTHDS